jgi:hypothetical protein
MKKLLSIFLTLVLATTGVFSQTLGNTNGQGPFAPGAAYSPNQFLGPFFQNPNFSFVPTSLQVSWTTGTIYVGNGGINIAPGAVTLTASKTTCSRANIIAGTDSCNYIYSTSAGVVATTTAIATALSGGNSILALAVTSASGVISLQAPYQDTGGDGGGITVSGMFVMNATCTPVTTSTLGITVFTGCTTVTGLASGDLLTIISQPAPTTQCPVLFARATGVNTLSLYIGNFAASACVAAAGTYSLLIAR